MVTMQSISQAKRNNYRSNDLPQRQINGTTKRANNKKRLTSNKSTTFSSNIATKLSIVVLLISCGFSYYIYYNHQQQQQLLIGAKLNNVINVTSALIQQWLKLVTNRFRNLFFDMTNVRPESVLQGLLSREASITVKIDSSIAVGLGGCTDLVVESLAIFDKFNAPFNPQPHAYIEKMQDLLELFAYYFKHGAASE